MKTTMYEDLRNEVQVNMTEQQKFELADKYADLIINSDERYISIIKRQSGYGTWKVRIESANEYCFGKKIEELLTIDLSSIVTHDEDKEFTIKDFEEDIQEKLVALIEELIEEIA